MLKAIWKGIKWFFNSPEKTHNKIARKHGFAHVRSNTQTPPIKVYGLGEGEQADIVKTYTQLTVLYKDRYLTDREIGAIEAAKKEIWIPRGITKEHLEHVLINCGFQRTPNFNGEQVFDPRLIQALNYAINMYSAKVASDLETVLSKNTK